MRAWELVLIAMGLAMDAFAVAVCMGLAAGGERRQTARAAVAAGGYFGVFQAGMPLAGYWLARWFAGYVQAFDHWVAFALLGFIGGKMVWEGWRSASRGGDAYPALSLGIRRMVPLALATSVDAMAVGVTFALRQVHIWSAVAIIGGITAVISAAGLLLGRLVGRRLRGKAELVGGVILVGMGLRILAEGLLGG